MFVDQYRQRRFTCVFLRILEQLVIYWEMFYSCNDRSFQYKFYIDFWSFFLADKIHSWWQYLKSFVTFQLPFRKTFVECNWELIISNRLCACTVVWLIQMHHTYTREPRGIFFLQTLQHCNFKYLLMEHSTFSISFLSLSLNWIATAKRIFCVGMK